MFQIDDRVDYARIQQFATQIENVSDRTKTQFDSHFGGKDSDDFYLGLLSGYANAYVVQSSEEISDKEKLEYIGALVAYVADKIAGRGL